ncbi:PhzF family phenazine biosynthesis protein [Anaerosacchariphilus polymeriproducens]|uniref:PhzF family phenazine biosynthesis protein n=1 Tax=Anaerosacchariphilus polymeriproducens TaxID=1812858 RepID=A0A371AVS5_9FIRM|nr:PhzF family phenazine biosynthesis protein [Anaerosacchariphilus polymeriproducens]RDU23676.1 PhzF family phenazine biosynthesis protein [Anaerosacchariphilus polymeriproducens]
MELFIVDAFTSQIFKGNQAGVVLLGDEESFPMVGTMQNIAAELKHSETAFVKYESDNVFKLKYYTPNDEIELCGHATISAFTVLRNEKIISNGNYVAKTLAGELNVIVETECIWLETAQSNLIKTFSDEASVELYNAFKLDISDRPKSLIPCIISTGVSDILLPVNEKEKLEKALPDRNRIVEISRKNHVAGIHMFYCSSELEVTAYCRNFAPLYGIDEESATGTSTGSLTYYLTKLGFVNIGSENIFIQGEALGRPAIIKSKMKNEKIIYIGGNAIVSIKGKIAL